MNDRAPAAPSPAPAAPAPPPSDHPWLDRQRFAQRRFLEAVDRGHQPQRATPDPAPWLAGDIAATWASLLQRDGGAVDPRDLILVASQAELWRAALSLLLAPGDAVLLAEPVPAGVLRAILQAGGQWIDLGRTAAGDCDPLALQRAAQAHPEAIYFAEQPPPIGDPRPVALPGGLRATLIDLQLAGWPTQLPAATAALLALRDPDDPGEPLLWALVTAPGAGQGLSLLLGDPQLPVAQAERARGVLHSWRDQPGWPRQTEQRLERAAERLSAWTRGWPGLAGAGARGLRWTAQCQGGDAAALFDALRGRVASMAALGPHPGQNLLLIDLCAAVADADAAPVNLAKV